MPNIDIEIDANVDAGNTDNFTTMVWVPGPTPVTDAWSPFIDATTNGYWYFTGAEAGITGCTQAGTCNLAQAKAALAAHNNGAGPATIRTLSVAKGRDDAFQGAVDGLRINDRIYDFESDGVHPKGAGK
jgi:hypothetical protein